MSAPAITDLSALLKDPKCVAAVSRAHVPAILAQLAALQVALAAHLLQQQEQDAEPEADRLLSISDASARLNVSQDWIYHRTKKLPFIRRVGGHVKASEQGLARYIANARHH